MKALAPRSAKSGAALVVVPLAPSRHAVVYDEAIVVCPMPTEIRRRSRHRSADGAVRPGSEQRTPNWRIRCSNDFLGISHERGHLGHRNPLFKKYAGEGVPKSCGVALASNGPAAQKHAQGVCAIQSSRFRAVPIFRRRTAGDRVVSRAQEADLEPSPEPTPRHDSRSFARGSQTMRLMVSTAVSGTSGSDTGAQARASGLSPAGRSRP